VTSENSKYTWVKSSLSYANGNCLEVAALAGGMIGVRNSRDPDGAVLAFTRDEWHAFIGGVRNGEFDRYCYRAWLTQAGNGGWELYWDGGHVATLGAKGAPVAAQAWANHKVPGGGPVEWVNLGGGPDDIAVEWLAVELGA
jgi:hypothetical protein